MEMIMKTANAAPKTPSKPKRDALADRYGAIGISAVAAAAPFIPARKATEAERLRYQIVTTD
jgi:hypothetical protein